MLYNIDKGRDLCMKHSKLTLSIIMLASLYQIPVFPPPYSPHPPPTVISFLLKSCFEFLLPLSIYCFFTILLYNILNSTHQNVSLSASSIIVPFPPPTPW